MRTRRPGASLIQEAALIKDIIVDFVLGFAAEEFCYLLCTNAKESIASIFEVSHGEFTSSVVHPGEVFKRTLLRNSAAVILAHNHPSGDPSPSSEDETVTRRLTEAGELLGVPVLDHIIVGFDGYFSFKQEGLI